MPFRRECTWVHRVWLTPDVPEDYEFIGELWQDMNPGWRVVNWDARALAEVGVEAVPRSFDLSPAAMRNAVGLALVHKYGGIYAAHPLEPTEPLLPAPEYPAWMTNSGYLGSNNPGDPVWGLLLELLRVSAREIETMSLTDFYLLYGGEDLLRFEITPRACIRTLDHLIEDPSVWN